MFVEGSKSLKSLPKEALRRLEGLTNRHDEVLIGDCRGADELAQRFSGHYDRVTIYATEGKARRGANGWDAATVDRPGKSSRIDRFGYACCLEKDAAMAPAADGALMVWDGRSRGTSIDILNMAALGKPIRVIMADGVGRFDIASFEDVHGLLPARKSAHVSARQSLACVRVGRDGGACDYETALSEFAPSKSMRKSFAGRPLTKGELIGVVLGSPRPLAAKLGFSESFAEADGILHEAVDVQAWLGGNAPRGRPSRKKYVQHGDR